jgi:assimilatory nitrate reductase catalytic subunit
MRMFEESTPEEDAAGVDPTGSRADVTTRTTCPYCGVGCGVLATPDGAGGADIAGDPAHPANFGRLCSKGSALGETLGLDGRLLHPLRRQGDGRYGRVSWDTSLDEIAAGFSAIVAREGPDAVAFYLSGQLLTEDYYVANKLMKGFIGSANVDTNSRLCMASAVAGHKRAFGADVVPGCYEDLDIADLVVLVGSNAAWCHPVLYQRIMRNRETRGAKLVVIDTRRTASSEGADLFLQIAPGGDQALFSGLLAHLAASGAADARYVADHTSGFDAALDAARRLAPDAAATADLTDLCEDEISAFFTLFAQTPRVVTAFSQGVNQSAQGTDKVNAILNCHLATGRIGRPGAGPLSLTGQPNAMGGREVGGLANTLAAHMGFEPESVDRVRRFWKAPRVATREGLKAAQMFEAIAQGKIKALWIAGTNPAASLPDADAARAALGRLELLVVSDNVRANDTIDSGAHFLLPAQAWGEKNGAVTNSERRISRQRAFLSAPGETRPDWAIFADVGRRMGFEGFSYSSSAAVFAEHASLSAFENDGLRAFDIGGLAQLTEKAYEALEPTQWPIPRTETTGRARLFSTGGFYASDMRAHFAVPATPRLAEEITPEFPLRLNTGRVRDQWHTMTRSGASARLARHTLEPFVEIHPQDAAGAGVEDDGFVKVVTASGACVMRARVTARQARGQIFAPIHWTDQTASHARIGALVAPHVDPISGQPESKATPAAIEPHAFVTHGFLLARRPVSLPQGAWWARATISKGVGYRLASAFDALQWRELVKEMEIDAERVDFHDEDQGVYRVALLKDERIELVLAVGPTAIAWEPWVDIFAAERWPATSRLGLLSGMAGGPPDTSPVVCACFNVTAARIEEVIASGCRDAAQVGKVLRAGTNCGSCLPEIKRLIG